MNNGTMPVGEGDAMSATGQTSVTGHRFLAKTPEPVGCGADGNLTSDGRWTDTWDGENRFVQMVANASVGPLERIKFQYEARGRRICKEVWDNTAGTGAPILDERLVYDRWNWAAVFSPQSAVFASFLWRNDLSGLPQGAGGVGGLMEVADYGSATTNCSVANAGNGNGAALINAADGTTVAYYEYGPFGELLRQTGPLAKADPFRFSTKYQDDESGLVYYGYRYYNPSTGRWLSRDPINEPGFALFGRDPLRSKNKPGCYLFIANNPLKEADYLGLIDFEKLIEKAMEYCKPALPGGEFVSALQVFGSCNTLGLALAWAKEKEKVCLFNAYGLPGNKEGAAEKACYKKWDKRIHFMQDIYENECKCSK